MTCRWPLTLLAVLLLTGSAPACRPCPSCPPPKEPAPPQVVTVTKSCMTPPMGLINPEWPEPNPDGSFTLTPSQASQFDYFLRQLSNYIIEQLEDCRLK